MKVCDVVLNSVWYDPRVRKQLIEYKENGVDVSCVGFKCSRYDEEKVKSLPCKTTIVQLPEKYEGKKRNPFVKVKREQVRSRLIAEAIIKEKPDIIHANDLDALIPAYQASKKLKCKLIYDSHEVYTENDFAKKSKILKFLLKRIERKLVKKIDLMVCVSHAAADYFTAEYGISKPLVVTNSSLKRERPSLTFKEKNEDFEVLNHGQFYEGRGYEVMIKAAELLKEEPNIALAVRGFGRLEASLRQQVEEKQLTNFRFYPPVRVEELVPEATKSMVGVAVTEPICLNFKLSVSNKLFEYAAAGLPVIMSNIPEHRYLNEKYRFGIVLEENTPDCFVRAVKKLYTEKEFYRNCSVNALSMSEEICWESEFEKLLSIERSLIG